MFEFLKKCYDPIDGDYYYTTLASAYSYDFAKMINENIPYMSDRENIVCCHLIGGEYEQYSGFRYQFQHDFNNALKIY